MTKKNLLICFFFLLANICVSQTKTFHLSDPMPQTRSANTAFDPSVTRTGKVRINDARNLETILQDVDNLSIMLFNDASFTAIKNTVRRTPSGAVYWYGELSDNRNGVVNLLWKDGLLVGDIHDYDADKVFDLTSDCQGQCSVAELDLQLQDEYEDCYHNEEIPEYEQHFRASAAEIASPDNPAYIDILILYPYQTALLMGSTKESITAKIEEIIEETNQIFINSAVYVQFRLAGHEMNDAIPHDNTSATTVRTTVGVSAIRDYYGADIVSHWNYDGSAGSGTVGSHTASANAGFNTSKYSEVISRYTFAHECGHNLGARHDRYEYLKSSSTTEISTIKPGYQFGKCFLEYRTVMAYDNSKYLPGSDGKSKKRIMHYSNPDVLYNGVPTGVVGEYQSSEGDGGPANAARMINECAKNAENWRESKIQTSIAPIENAKIRIIPNPASELIKIENLTKGEQIKIYNSAGILMGNYEAEQISVSHFPAGIYFLKTSNNTLKFLKK
ncbi:MAG: M12 family metallo-peptidase [Dysgonamonadaceae bacterium]|jgi:hypothetical protein|nr:M12 family metallo-peptidase [Dysgonamonadaceae bacterium]